MCFCARAPFSLCFLFVQNLMSSCCTSHRPAFARAIVAFFDLFISVTLFSFVVIVTLFGLFAQELSVGVLLKSMRVTRTGVS